MPDLQVSCPNCQKAMRVPQAAIGKRIRCKACEAIFAVPAPKAKPASAKALPPEMRKSTKPKKPKPVEPEPEDAPLKFADEEEDKKKKGKYDDDDDDANPYGVDIEEDVPRCPHCALELDPPDTKICTNCGYDMLARRRHASKKIYEHTFGDYFMHLLPGVIWLLVVIAFIAANVYCYINMREWLSDSFLEQDEEDPITKNKKFYVAPGCFTMCVTLITLAVTFFGGRFAIKRLILNPKPEEVEKRV